MSENKIFIQIVNAAKEIHRNLGPGLFKSTYETCLVYELQKNGLFVQSQVPLPLIYEGIEFDFGFKADLLVENKVITEVKALENLQEIHSKELLTYLRLSQKKLGLIINFNSVNLDEEIKRIDDNWRFFHGKSGV
jgi:GxxExxY protein